MAGRAVPARYGSPVLHPPVVEQQVPGGQRGLPGPGGVLRPGWDGRGGLPGAAPGADAGDLGSRSLGIGQAEVHVHLVGDLTQHVQVGPDVGNRQGRAERAAPALPVDERARFSTTAATGRTTSARSVTALTRSSRLTMNGVTASAASAAAGSAQVGGVDTGDDEGAELTGGRGGEDAGGVTAGLRRQRRDAPGPRDLHAGVGVRDRPADREQARHRSGLDRAALTRAARDPDEPCAGRLGQPGRGRQRTRASASRSPTRMMAPGAARAPAADLHRTASAAAAPPCGAAAGRAGPAPPPPRRPMARASSPGTVASRSPDSLASPRVANGAIAKTCRSYLRTAFRSRRKTMGDSSSGSNPASSTAGFEPEEESPIVFLRLRKAVRKYNLQVFAIAPFATRGLAKLSGDLLATVPGEEARAIGRLGGGGAGPARPAAAPQGGAAAAEAVRWKSAAGALAAPGAIILVGERLAEVPGALSAAAGLAEATGARLVWNPAPRG